MKLTTRGKYALQALVDLVNHAGGKPVKLEDIANRQNLSLHYLEQLFRHLRRGSVVKSVRGPGGGYVLAKDVNDTSLRDILKSVNELTSYNNNAQLDDTASNELVSAHKFATMIDEATMKVLDQSLASLL